MRKNTELTAFINSLIAQIRAEHRVALYWRRLFFMALEETPF